MTKKKTPDDGDLANAYICLFGLFFEFEDDLPSKYPNPETVAIKRDLFEKLSEEAKEVITVLFNSPKEFEQFCTCLRTGQFKNRKGDRTFFVKRYFRKSWKSRNRVNQVFAEVQKFLREVEL